MIPGLKCGMALDKMLDEASDGTNGIEMLIHKINGMFGKPKHLILQEFSTCPEDILHLILATTTTRLLEYLDAKDMAASKD